jgi:Deoxyribose-phosphate aldolase
LDLIVYGVHGRCAVAASGCFSSVEDMDAFLALGANRLGCFRAVKLLNGEKAKGY